MTRHFELVDDAGQTVGAGKFRSSGAAFDHGAKLLEHLDGKSLHVASITERTYRTARLLRPVKLYRPHTLAQLYRLITSCR